MVEFEVDVGLVLIIDGLLLSSLLCIELRALPPNIYSSLLN